MTWDWLFRPGEALPEPLRERMEERLGFDLRDVRVHHDEEAHEAARAMNAEAFTSGRDVYFAAGKYAADGGALLAHELAHVAQQRGDGGDGSDTLEHDADAVVAGHAAQPAGRAPAGAVQRQKPPGSLDAKLDDIKLHLPFEAFRVDDFDPDKWTIKPSQEPELKRAAETINAALPLSPDSFVSIAGHTDATDTEAHNLKLGQQRADAVLEYLVKKGVPRSIVHAGSLGESALLIDTQKAEPRNRRVEIFFTRRNFFSPQRFRLKLEPPPAAPAPATQKQVPGPIVPLKSDVPNVDWLLSPEYNDMIERLRAMKSDRKSVADVFGQFGRAAAKKLRLPAWAQDKVESFARDLPAKTLKQIFDTLTADTQLSAAQKDAIHHILEAIPQMK